MLYYPNLDLAIAFHDEIIKVSGGKGGYNNVNIGYLDSALKNITNDEYYPTFLDKITHLIFSCVKFHPFNDANKRTAISISILFLELNGFKEYALIFAYIMEQVVVDLAENKITKDDLKSIINDILYQ